jgi:peroxiredoxin
MIRLIALFCFFQVAGASAQVAGDLDRQIAEATLIHKGAAAPDFTCTTLDGRSFSLSGQKGKVVLLYFFASSVPFSFTEMRYIQKEIMEKLEKREDFTVLCIGRGHSRDEMVKISGENNLRLPLAADADAAIYRRMFTKFVPRTVLIARDGSIAYLANGSKEFEGIVKLQQAIEIQLKKQD